MTQKSPNTIFRIFTAIIKYVALAIFTLYLLVWLLSPVAVRYGAKEYLATNGLTLSDESEVRYNPFLSSIDIRNLNLLKGQEKKLELKKLTLEVDLHKFLFDRIHVKVLSITGLIVDINIADEQISIAGFTIPSAQDTAEEEQQEEKTPHQTTEKEAALPYTITVPGIALSDSELHVFFNSDQAQIIGINDFRLNDISVSQDKQSVDVYLTSTIAKGEVKATSEIRIENEATLVSSSLNITSLQLEEFKTFLPPELHKLAAEFSVEANTVTKLSQSGLDIQAKDSAMTINDLELGYENLALTAKSYALNIDHASWQQTSEGEAELVVGAKTALEQLRLQPEKSQDILLGFEQFVIGPISLSSRGDFSPAQTQLLVESLTLEGLVGSQKQGEQTQGAMMRLAKVSLEGSKFSGNTLSINNINLDSLNSQIYINPDKSIAQQVDFTPPGATDEAPDTSASETATVEAEPDSPATGLKIGLITISGENQIEFKDQSVSPSYERTFFIDTLTLENIDSLSNELSPFTFAGRSNEYAKIDLKGAVAPFSEEVNLELAGKLQEVSLPAISSYIKDSLGFELKSGQLDSDLDVKVVASELDGKVKLRLRGLDMSASKPPEETNLKGQAAIPLNVALGMLKDKKGNIKLDVPLTGSVDEPGFGVSSFLVLISKKAVMSQAKSYLMQTFVPYASVVSVAISAGEFALKLRFEDLPFSPTIVQIDESQTQYMHEFITLMKDKSKTQVKVCAIATPEDIGRPAGTTITDKADLDQLHGIAKQRGEAFKKYAVSQGEIASSRMLLCNPNIDFSKKAAPRIEISI